MLSISDIFKDRKQHELVRLNAANVHPTPQPYTCHIILAKNDASVNNKYLKYDLMYI